ncbi:MAG: EamA family transporter [Lachnospiraceae bacterium]
MKKEKYHFSAKMVPVFLVLHLALVISSLSGVCSKMAARQEFLSWGFVFWFGMVLALMFVYAVIWQQVLKRLPLTVAFANRPVTLVWSFLWGSLLFQETITWNMVLGGAVIFVGIYLVVSSDE